MARSLLKEKDLPNKFWAEAVATSFYLLNLSPTKAIMNTTPFEAWSCKRPSVHHLKVFGCIAYTLLDAQHRLKLYVKSEKCVFIGYYTETKTYK